MRTRLWILVGAVTLASAGLLWQWRSGQGSRQDADGNPPAGRTAEHGVSPSRWDDTPATIPASAQLRARERAAEAIGRFDTWAARYLGETDPVARRAMLEDGVAAATRRRATLREMISADPERALRQATPWGVRQGLPAEIQELLEDRIDGMGAYHAIVAVADGPVSDEFRATRRETVIDGVAYETHVYGRRLELGSRERLAVHGIAIDGQLALLDSPVRLLEAGEPLPVDRSIEDVCAVSGKSTAPASPDAPSVQIAADTGDRIIYLCSAGHVSVLAANLEAGEEQAAGGGDAAPVAAAESDPVTGAKRVLMIRVRFADQPSWFEPESTASAEAMFAATNAFYMENSFGALCIDGTVSPVYALPQTAAWYSANDSSGYALNVLNAARAIAADPASAPGNDGLVAINYLDYDFEAVRYTTGPGIFSGQGYVAMRGCWLKSPDPGVLMHELGHNLGLWHANAWTPADDLDPLGSGTNAEYGDVFDTMGPPLGGAGHFNAWEKTRLGWLPDSQVATASGSAVVTLAAHDLGGAISTDRHYALRIVRDDDRDYWLEFRRHARWMADRPAVHGGIGVRWDPWLMSNGGTQLLDTTPGSAGGRDDATLAIGRTFSDPGANIHVTTLGYNLENPDAIDVEVRLGAAPGNRTPSVSASADVLEAAIGQTIQFTATASDPDGDALSYSWSFDGETATASGPVVARGWSVGGDHRARVTVSDRKGGSVSASAVVRVGAAVGSRISGRVVDLSGNPIPGVRVSNATERGADGYDETWTEADGTYTLLGVPAGSWTMTATAPGWMFALDGFSRPVTTPDDCSGLTILGCWKGFSVSGSVRRADGSAVTDAFVRTGGRSEPTDRAGEFAVHGLVPGRHVLAVEAPGAAFDALTVEIGLADVSTLLITEKTFAVSGTIAGPVSSDVTITTGWQATTLSSSAASGGQFTLTGVPAGTWALRAVAAGVSYSPEGFAPPLEVAGDVDHVGLTLDATPQYAIAGTVFDRGAGMSGVRVATGDLSTVTDSRGGYWLAGLAAGTHVVSVSAAGVAFDPGSRSVEIGSGHVSGVDFVSNRVNEVPTLVSGPSASAPFNRPFIAISADAADDEGAAHLRYWWEVAGDAPGYVDFSVNGANAARETIACFSMPGEYRLRVSAVDRHGLVGTSELTVAVGSGTEPPVLVEIARADPAIVGNSLQTRLTVRAASEVGDANLIYTWHAEDGAPGPVSISPNATPTAREAIARFQAPGNYLLHVTARDPLGRTVESSVSVYVEPTYDAWLWSQFDPAVVADPALKASMWGELADPDGDGLANLLEYAFGGDPAEPSAEARPVTGFVTDNGVEYLAVTFRPNPNAVDLIFEPQASSDLENWQAGLVLVPGADDRVLTYRDFLPAADQQRRFLRVHVSTRAE